MGAACSLLLSWVHDGWAVQLALFPLLRARTCDAALGVHATACTLRLACSYLTT